MIEGIIKTKLKIINQENGSIYHVLRSTDKTFDGFGEIYFSSIKKGATKGWTLHTKMTLNLIVPIGKIIFNFIDMRETSQTYNKRDIIIMSRDNYFRLTVPPNIIFAFRGLEDSENILVNVADMIHDPNESIKKNINDYEFLEDI